MPRLDSHLGVHTTAASSLPRQFQSFSQYRCKTAKKSEEEIDFLRSNPKIWNVHSVLNVLHSLVDKSNINRQLEVYTSGGECRPRRSLGSRGAGSAGGLRAGLGAAAHGSLLADRRNQRF